MTRLRGGFFVGLVLGLVVVGVVGAVVAVQGSSGKRIINLPGRTTQAPFSDAVMVGDTLYVAGRLGLDPETSRPPGRVEHEVRLILDGITAVLAEADMTMDDLVSIQVFCSDVSLYGRFNTIYTTYFTEAPPARAFIGSGPLLRGGRFEVMGIAVSGQRSGGERCMI